MRRQLEVKARRVGGATYQVPIEIRPERRQTLAFAGSWEFAASAARTPWASASPANSWTPPTTGNAVKRKEEMHRMAEANKAFAHYRW